MTIFLKILMLILMALAPVIISTSCSKEDDIEEIFMGKTFYISGATINGKALNDEVKELYENPDSYYITFNETTFNGKLDVQCHFSGYWSADGKKKTMIMHIDQYVNTSSSVLTEKIYGILQHVTAYSGDANIINIKADEQNFLRLRLTKR
ncbi:MAG: DUF4847 family protein [Bacteroidaceae bacterium]|nr:DUF4847 family protein [Bacteroidaceae bacterium]